MRFEARILISHFTQNNPVLIATIEIIMLNHPCHVSAGFIHDGE